MIPPGLPSDDHARTRIADATAASPADDLASDTWEPPPTIPGFRLGSCLGRGGMGVVYRAVQESVAREVALKVIAPRLARDRGFVARFLREARATAAVTHPNLVGCHDVGRAGDHLYMVLELMEGGDCARLVARAGGQLPEERAVRIVMDCCRGLRALAQAGIVHRDLKPANVYLTASGVAKLGDFGLALPAHEHHLTRAGTPVGTPAYMAPEQVRGDAPPDTRADLYGLGATLYYLLTGEAPYVAETPWGVLVAVLNDPVPDPRRLRPSLSPGVAGVVMRCLAKDRRERPPHPDALLEDLVTHSGLPRVVSARAALLVPAQAPTVCLPAPTEVLPAPPAAPRPWRRRLLALAAAAALLAAVGTTLALRHASTLAAAQATAEAWQASLRANGIRCQVAPGGQGLLAVTISDPGLTSLDPLIGMPLGRLDCAGARHLAGDLHALAGLPLTTLRLAGCDALQSLNGLQGLPLTTIDCTGCTGLTDLAPLAGAPLRSACFAGCTGLTDLTPLAHLPLTSLDLSGCTGIASLAALAGAPLQSLDLDGCRGLETLAPLSGAPLARLRVIDCPATLPPLPAACLVVRAARAPDAAGPGGNPTQTSFAW